MAKRGPKPAYDRLTDNQLGAPKLTVRLDADCYQHIQSQPDGPRAYIQRVVRADMETGVSAKSSEQQEPEAQPS